MSGAVTDAAAHAAHRPVASRALEDRVGIIQGRLVPSATGELQCSPGPLWREEFAIAAEVGLHHIELVAEWFPTPSNPIWTTDGRQQIADAVARTGVRTPSICIDETLTTPIDNVTFARDLATRFAPVVRELGITVVVVPLSDKSDLAAVDRSRAAQSIRLLADELAVIGARVALELSVPAVTGLDFLAAAGNHPNTGVCYDTGNATALGYDVPAELRLLGPRVWHVHAKDKNQLGHNVRYGLGGAPFDRIFDALVEAGFEGLVTMETTRGENPVVTAAQHRAFLLDEDRSARQRAESSG